MKISIKLLIVMFLSFSILFASCSKNEKIGFKIGSDAQTEEVMKEEKAQTSEDIVEIIAEEEEDIELGELI